jgi:hypothetical protein
MESAALALPQANRLLAGSHLAGIFPRRPQECRNELSGDVTLVVHDGDLWLMSTPNGKRGFFWEEWDHGGSEWERISVPATDCPRISERVLAEEKASAGDKWFRQEYLCECVDRQGAVFSRDVIDGAYQDYPGLAL